VPPASQIRRTPHRSVLRAGSARVRGSLKVGPRA
jgi:hypothetical protein